MKKSHFLLRVSFTRCTQSLCSFGNTLKPQEKLLLIFTERRNLAGAHCIPKVSATKFLFKFMHLLSRASCFKLLQPFPRRRPGFNSSPQQLAEPKKLLEVNLTITILVDFLSGCHWYIHLNWQFTNKLQLLEAYQTKRENENGYTTWITIWKDICFQHLYYLYRLWLLPLYDQPPKKTTTTTTTLLRDT